MSFYLVPVICSDRVSREYQTAGTAQAFFKNYIYNHDQTWSSPTWPLQCTMANSVVH